MLLTACDSVEPESTSGESAVSDHQNGTACLPSSNSTTSTSGTPSKSDGVTNSFISESFSCAGRSYSATSDTVWDGSLFVGTTTTINISLTRDNGTTETYSDYAEYFDRDDSYYSGHPRVTATADLGGFGCHFLSGSYWAIPGSCVASIDIVATHKYYMIELSSSPYVVTTDLHYTFDNSGSYY